VRKEAERLVRQARRDLDNARKIIATGAYEVTAFLSQQAVEKYLKAVWLEKLRKRAPATHALRELAEGLDLPAELLPRLNYLSPDYTVSRYPDAANGVPYELYDETVASAKVDAAEEVAEWVEKRLS
jgi:HEPN domain-containing protein